MQYVGLAVIGNPSLLCLGQHRALAEPNVGAEAQLYHPARVSASANVQCSTDCGALWPFFYARDSKATTASGSSTRKVRLSVKKSDTVFVS